MDPVRPYNFDLGYFINEHRRVVIRKCIILLQETLSYVITSQLVPIRDEEY